MTLSEHEQRQLEAIERALYADDPKFASTVRYTDPKVHGRRRLITGIAVIVLGLLVLLAGAVLSLPWVGVAGFVLMLLGAMRGWTALRRLTGRQAPTREAAGSTGTVVSLPTRRRRRARGNSGLVERLEQRWRRRFDEQ